MKKYYLFLTTFFLTQLAFGQIVNIPDANFKNALLTHSPTIDTNNDGNIQVSEAEAVLVLGVYFKGIASLEGIQSFKNLTFLNCSNNKLTSLNVSGLVNLRTLHCSTNQLPSIDVGGLVNLRTLNIFNNKLTSLDVSNLVNLTTLDCGTNQLSSLDVSSLINLNVLYCSTNTLVSLFLKNGRQISQLGFGNNPTLEYICADEANISYYLNAAIANGNTNCQVNSYCFFMPGGTFYTLKGKTTVDVDANGCDANDNPMPYLKYLISGNAGNASIIANNTGNYTIALQAGAYTITPQLENSAYFTVSPTNKAINFATNSSSALQDFCIIPKDVHNDVEVTLIPFDRARPGFDTKYKLVYKNKGNTTLSGSLTLNFQDDVMKFLSATPNVASQTPNTLVWDYTNLKPFDSKEIFFTMKLNTPIDATNPLIGGAVLAFTATINPVIADETALDNVFKLNQTVINSFDPNDKTCLEGSKITSEIVGNYVHYMIRFENTGSADAVNIVVKDKIDITKFDISTLIPEDASHNFVTNIKQTNDVEFIFEGINLPFDDANNDGYVSFKIKTLPTLAIGSTFENGSEIYFDYNAPIVTNIATTKIVASLGVPEMAVSVSNVFPNPVTDVLTIENKFDIQEVTIFDVQGRMVKKVVPLSISNVLHIEMIQLHTGTYFVKTVSEQGMGVQKIIKN